MQLMIDLTATNDAATLRRVAALLIAVANDTDGGVAAPSVPSGTVDEVRYVRPADIAPHRSLGDATREELGLPPAPPVPVPVPLPPAAIIPPPPPPAPTSNLAADSSAAEAPTTVVASAAANVQLDKRGFPHDARIHSATPSINKSDDCWRGRRGLDNATLETVEAELRAKGFGVPAKPAAAVVPPPPSPSVPLPPSVPARPAVVVAGTNAPAPTVMVPPPPPGVAGVLPGNGPSAPVDMFRALMAKLKDKTGENGPLRREIMQPLYTEFGVSGPQDFHKKRDQIPALLARIDQLLGV